MNAVRSPIAEVLARSILPPTVFVASAGLLLLFFLMDYLIWVVIVIFCIGGTQGMIACFSAVAKSLLPKRYHRVAVVPCCGEVPVISLALMAPCMGIALWWVVERHADYSWVLQDIMRCCCWSPVSPEFTCCRRCCSVCLLMLMQRTIRLVSGPCFSSLPWQRRCSLPCTAALFCVLARSCLLLC